ncbi:hypothetical protein DIR46_07095 [Massilia oculi]|uniref:Superinfection immunity protein n=2 Tax=Massilia oculi TaxID=945844 RepID=A0A2S2DS61_9BURK|nr:hypothetical protein DIR46_07095 [Massilia oculi]
MGVVALFIYFWPTLRARDVRHPAFTSIFLINLLLGWLFIPWVLVLAWAYRHKKVVEPPTKKCPECAEIVLLEATRCKHCQAVMN